ncbi:CC0125/CC1285 family lipoprotein [Rickettsiella endosymbiont of Dermanyssus gallinae]|uniref:CC0125/CC1285 family lipoprotein n=1 Tax=Rickettsiella endosymbiont of Dermanyssus gallinae TaxID=2856608 RepID=UPI001C52F176|nr:hypothetical protein [Rickettsiella endosymbiont of Dermanyssus gallinae]
MSKKKCFFLLPLLTLALTGCATTYQPSGFSGGYEDIQLSENIYKISFNGNSFASKELVQNYLLRRCADVTIQKGYKYFVILNENIEVSRRTITTPATVQTNSINTFMGNSVSSNGYSTINYGQNITSNRYGDIAVIKLLKNNNKYANALNAEIILSNFQNAH